MEDLSYRRLLDLYYLSEQPLTGCVDDVAREIGLSEHKQSVEYVLTKFFTLDENVFRQKRIDLEIKKYKSNAKNKSKAGKASAKARQAKASSDVTGVEQVLNTTPTDEQLNINHKPLTINQETLTNLKDKDIENPPVKKESKKAKGLTEFPDSFEITEKMVDWFFSQGFKNINIEKATDSWVDGMKAKGMKYKDWTAAWRTGMNNAEKWSAAR